MGTSKFFLKKKSSVYICVIRRLVVDAEWKVFLFFFFFCLLLIILSKICKTTRILVNNFTMTSPQKGNPERWTVYRFSIGVLRNFGHNWIIITKSKGYNFWHGIHEVWKHQFTNVISCVYVSGRKAGLNLARYLSNTSP